MIKVCHITSAHNSDDVRIFYKECTSLARAGYDTFLVARGESREENGVHVIGVGQPLRGRLSRMTEFADRVYKKAMELDADIYHFHDPELLPYGERLKKKGKKVIFDSHENSVAQIERKQYFPNGIRKTVAQIYKKIETRAVSQFDAVVVPCTFDGVNIFQMRAKRTCFLPNYPVLADFFQKYDPSCIREKKICYIGSLTEDRGITSIVKAAYVAGVKLVLAGSFQSNEYKKRIESMEAYSAVEWLGVVPNTEVAEILQKMTVGMQVVENVGQYSAADTLGVKVFEYLSMGLPVIVSDAPYIKSILKEYEFGICVDPQNIVEIAEAIKYFINNPSEVHRMGENGRRAVEKEYNWGTQEKKLFDLYRSLYN